MSTTPPPVTSFMSSAQKLFDPSSLVRDPLRTPLQDSGESAAIEYYKSQLRELDTLYRNADRIHDALRRFYEEHPGAHKGIHITHKIRGHAADNEMGYVIYKNCSLASNW